MSKPRVLLVEPDSATSGILEDHLGKNNFNVSTSVSAQTAVHCADKHRPDVVVLELDIADQNGLAFLHEFRSHADWLEIPVVIHTFVPRVDSGLNAKQWQALGVVDYLYKPTTTLVELKRVLDKVVSS